MTISYKSEVEDAAEPSIRMYLRSKTARDARLVSILSGFGFIALPFTVLYFFQKLELLLVIGVVVGFISAILNYLYFASAAKRRILKYYRNQSGSLFPAIATYTIEAGRIEYASEGVKLSFDLCDLSLISEDETTFELKFGEKGLCVIPLRAFKSINEKNDFMTKLKSEPRVPVGPTPSGT